MRFAPSRSDSNPNTYIALEISIRSNLHYKRSTMVFVVCYVLSRTKKFCHCHDFASCSSTQCRLWKHISLILCEILNMDLSRFYKKQEESFQNALKELDFCLWSLFAYGILKWKEVIWNAVVLSMKNLSECCGGVNLLIKSLFYVSTLSITGCDWCS